MHGGAATRWRCLAVALGLTAALWGAAAVLVRAAAGQPAGPGQPLVRLCLAALAVAVGWAWLQGMAGVAEAWSGRPAARDRRGLRRLALVACGVAVASALAAPSYALAEGPRPDPLAGLPLPDRAQGGAAPAGSTVVVRPGDSLWAVAERTFVGPATDRQVCRRWQAIYHDNRGLIGPDPDLIRPGQVLEISEENP
jgi:nucleoid-associated protein YgaU